MLLLRHTQLPKAPPAGAASPRCQPRLPSRCLDAVGSHALCPPSSSSLPCLWGRVRCPAPTAFAAAAAGDADYHEAISAPAAAVVATSFETRRLIVFFGFTLCYCALYLTRGSLTYTAPAMVAERGLAVTMADIGTMTSAFPVAYGISKFASGVLGSKMSARYMLGLGLIATALVNIAFGYSTSVVWYTALWFANGSLQGMGSPASATLLTSWFASKERGTYWGLWNTASNIGGALAPILVGQMVKAFGWQWGMWTPGIIGVVVGIAALALIQDSPQEAGYPPVEAPVVGAKPAEAVSVKDTLMEVLRNPSTWLLGIAYFFVYLVRQGATSWLVFYLISAKGATDAAQAALSVSGLEIGGLLGGTLAGILSDARIGSAGENGHVGRRVQLVFLYTACTIGALALLRAVPAGNATLTWLSIAALGFFIYGPQMLIGLCGAELVQKSSVGAVVGFLGLISYLGAANAGIPLSACVRHFGWDGYFVVMAGCCVVTLLLLLPLLNAPSYLQLARRKQEAKAE